MSYFAKLSEYFLIYAGIGILVKKVLIDNCNYYLFIREVGFV